MAAQRSHGLLLCCLVILPATHEVQGLFECLIGCPTRCQRDYHESLPVCAVFCGMKCTCFSGGSCSFLGPDAQPMNSDDGQDLKLLDAAWAKVAGTQLSVPTEQSSRKTL